LVVSYRRFRTYRSELQWSSSPRTVWPLNMEPKFCPRISVPNHESALRNIPEERKSRLTPVGSCDHVSFLLLSSPRALCLCCRHWRRRIGRRGHHHHHHHPIYLHWCLKPWTHSAAACSSLP
jgi:hypothetical protein